MEKFALTLPENYTLETLQAEVDQRVEKLKKVVVDPTNPKACEDLRTENNAFLKSITDSLNKCVDEYSRPAVEYIQQYAEVLTELAVLNKQLGDDILNFKKEQFKQKVKDKYIYLLGLSEDGIVPSFEELYEPTWYGKPEKVWFSALVSKFDHVLDKDVSVDCFIRIRTNKAKYNELLNFLKNNLINYEEV